MDQEKRVTVCNAAQGEFLATYRIDEDGKLISPTGIAREIPLAQMAEAESHAIGFVFSKTTTSLNDGWQFNLKPMSKP